MYLFKNEIETIEMNSFDSLINLKQLYLLSNKIRSIQNGLFKNLNNQEILWLQQNEIETMVRIYIHDYIAQLQMELIFNMELIALHLII